MSEAKMKTSERLKNIREEMGKTQKEMASTLGIAPRTWQNYEEGIHEPSWKVMEGLLELGFNANWIFTGKGEKKRGDSTALFPSQIDLNIISKKISAVRGTNSTSEFARILQIPEDRLVEIENAQLEPGYGLLDRICRTFKINASWLLGDSDEMIAIGFDVDKIDLKLLDIATMMVDSLDEMRSESELPISSQKKAFLSIRLYENLKRKGFDLESETPSQAIQRLIDSGHI